MVENLCYFVVSFLYFCSASKLQPRISNAKPSSRGQFPYYVYLEISYENRWGVAACGAALISNKWIITTSGCIPNAGSITIHLGSLERKNRNERGRAIDTVNISRSHEYESNKRHYVNKALGLIKLTEPVVFNDVIKPIKMLPMCEFVENMIVYTVGNGFISMHRPELATILQWTQLKTIPLARCRMYYKLHKSAFPGQPTICAENASGSSPHYGDVGSPLVHRSSRMLVGVLNYHHDSDYGKGCPMVFHHIGFHYEWISNITGIEMPKCNKHEQLENK